MIAGVLGLLGLAYADCGAPLGAVPDQQSVVWISPLRKTVSANRLVRVMPTSAIRDASPGSVGRLLQLAGIRKKATNPRRPWKVTVFDASSGALCRPVEDADASEFVAGLPVCASKAGATKRDSGCGTTVDRASGDEGVEVYRARWRDLAPQGFCVIPAERFVAELGR